MLDDNRLYRRTDPGLPPPPPPKPKANSKKAKAAARASKRRKVTENGESTNDADAEDTIIDAQKDPSGDGGFGDRKWECIAVTLMQYQDFLDTIRKSRDPDEKALVKRISDEVLPFIEKAEEAQQRRQQKKERELNNIQKLATAKRSSRLADKQEREREAHEAAEAERKRKADLAAAKEDQERQKNMEEARENRMMTREQRIKDREYKRLLHEEELANMSEDSKKLDAGGARMSERHLKKEMEKQKREIAALEEEDEWTFDCSVCGVHGENLVNPGLFIHCYENFMLTYEQDDGTHSIACEKCNIWQHSACHGISEAAAEKDDFHFMCQDCKRRAEDALKPKIPSLKFRLGSSTSPPSSKVEVRVPSAFQKRKADENARLPLMRKFKLAGEAKTQCGPAPSLSINGQHAGQNGMHRTMMQGPTLSPQGQLPHPSNHSSNSALAASPPPGLRSPPGPPAYTNGYADHITQQNGYTPRPQYTLSETQSSRFSGTGQSHLITPNAAWSATYEPPRSAETPNQATPVPHFANPFHNSFTRQRPTSSHSQVTNGPTLSSAPSTYSPTVNGYPQAPNPASNGLPSQTYSLPPPLPPPVKHQSSPPTTTANHLPSSSPNLGPNLHREAPPSPGFSPTKQTSPRPAPINPGTATSPPPSFQNHTATGLSPIKQRSPPPKPIEPSSSPIAGPKLHNRSPSNLGFSPTKHSPSRPPPIIGNGVEKVMPPVEQLAPSPNQGETSVPTKAASPLGEVFGNGETQ